MAAQKNKERDLDLGGEPVKPEPLCERVARNVLMILGTPPDYSDIRAARVGPSSFRVNVYTSDNKNSGYIADKHIKRSFHVIVDGDGHILIAVPRLAREF